MSGVGNGVPVGYGPAMGRDRIERVLIAGLILATVAMVALTVWDWVR